MVEGEGCVLCELVGQGWEERAEGGEYEEGKGKKERKMRGMRRGGCEGGRVSGRKVHGEWWKRWTRRTRVCIPANRPFPIGYAVLMMSLKLAGWDDRRNLAFAWCEKQDNDMKSNGRDEKREHWTRDSKVFLAILNDA